MTNMKKEKVKNQSRFGAKTKAIFMVLIVLVLGLGLLTYFGNLPVALGDEPFCNIDTDLYNTIIRNVDVWKSAFPDEFDAFNENDSIFFTTNSGEKFVVHAVYWTTDTKAPIFFVPIKVPLRRMLEIGLYGLFYTPNEELPSYGVVGEMIHLGNQIYCYRVEKPS